MKAVLRPLSTNMFSSTKLKQVVGIDRAGSFSAAAKAMHISQSTLTKAVADVESELGFSLFLRTARGVVATSRGREFLNRAARIVTDLDILIDDAKAQRSERDLMLRIGISPASQEGLFNRVIATLLKEQPEICLSMSGLPIERGIRMLKHGDIDLLFTPKEEIHHEPDLTTECVSTIRASLFCRKDHPILSVERPTREHLRDCRLIVSEVDNIYARKIADVLLRDVGDAGRRLHIIEHFAVIAESVATTNLIGVVSNSYAKSNTFRARFSTINIDIFQPLEISATRLSRWEPSFAVRACLDVFKRHPVESEG